MRKFTYAELMPTAGDDSATVFYMSGQAIPFINGIAELADPSPLQMAWLDKKIRQGSIVETTSDKKKVKSKRAAKKKGG